MVLLEPRCGDWLSSSSPLSFARQNASKRIGRVVGPSCAVLPLPIVPSMSDSSDNESSKKGKSSKSAQKWGEKLKFLSPISKPLASRKETKHILKLVKKGMN